MTVYAIVKEPWKSEEGYLARFRSEVFANKAKAVSALKDIARKIVREQIGDANGAELEFEKDEVRIAWGHAGGNGESPETTCLRVERLQVPKGRIEFEDGKASVEDWVELLKEQPRFAKHCDWGKIDGGGWVSLLKKYPRFAKHCNWELLRGRDWCELLVELPKFKTHLIRERLKDGTLAKSGWMVGFLEKFPEYISDCDLNELGEDWARFLMTYPQYAKQCDFSGFCADDWGKLLPVHPEFIDKVNWSITWQKKYYCGCVLIELIDKLPEILSYCKWSELRGDVLVEVLKHFPGAADKCDWERLAEADWYNLLQTHPEYGDRCTCWGSFTGWQIGKLLSANAALARFMKFDEFSEEKLADILITSPNPCGLVDCSRIKDKIDVLRVCAVHPEYCAKLAGGECWRHIHGYVWRGLSGPVVVITVNNWIRQFPDYPCAVEERAGRYQLRWGVLTYDRRRGNDRMGYEEARQVVEEIFSKHTRVHQRSLAIDGVYVEDESEGSGASIFASIMKEWFANNESSIKLLYLECGYVYGTSVLSDESETS